MGKAQLAELEQRGCYFSVPRGRSMWPMLRSKQDVVEIHALNGPAKRYDLVLYIRGSEQGVIHRVLRVRDAEYIIAGDNCWQKEYVKREQVRGIATRFCRSGKWHDVEDPGYRLYVHLWTDFFWLRRPLFYLRDRAKRLLRLSHVRK